MSGRKQSIRKITESSGLAQSIADTMMTHPESSSLAALAAFKYFVNIADHKNNDSIYYENDNGNRYLIIKNIPTYDLQCALLGLAARYTDDEGQYTVDVRTTHGLNSAVINVTDLMYQIRNGKT